MSRNEGGHTFSDRLFTGRIVSLEMITLGFPAVRIVLSFVLSVILVSAAASHAMAEEKKGGKDGPKDPALALQVEMLPIAVPVMHGGTIANYVFVRTRVYVFKPTDASIVHDKEPYIRDILVRAANRTPYSLPDDLNRIDTAPLEKLLQQSIDNLVGHGVVKRVEIFDQHPQRGLPRPKS